MHACSFHLDLTHSQLWWCGCGVGSGEGARPHAAAQRRTLGPQHQQVRAFLKDAAGSDPFHNCPSFTPATALFPIHMYVQLFRAGGRRVAVAYEFPVPPSRSVHSVNGRDPAAAKRTFNTIFINISYRIYTRKPIHTSQLSAGDHTYIGCQHNEPCCCFLRKLAQSRIRGSHLLYFPRRTHFEFRANLRTCVPIVLAAVLSIHPHRHVSPCSPSSSMCC